MEERGGEEGCSPGENVVVTKGEGERVANGLPWRGRLRGGGKELERSSGGGGGIRTFT